MCSRSALRVPPSHPFNQIAPVIGIYAHKLHDRQTSGLYGALPSLETNHTHTMCPIINSLSIETRVCFKMHAVLLDLMRRAHARVAFKPHRMPLQVLLQPKPTVCASGERLVVAEPPPFWIIPRVVSYGRGSKRTHIDRDTASETDLVCVCLCLCLCVYVCVCGAHKSCTRKSEIYANSIIKCLERNRSKVCRVLEPIRCELS